MPDHAALPWRSQSITAAAQVLVQTAGLFLVYRLVTRASDIETLGLWSTAAATLTLISFLDLGLTDLMVREASRSAGTGNWARVKGIFSKVLVIVAVTTGTAALIATPLVAEAIRGAASTNHRSTAFGLVAGAAGTVWLGVLTTATTGLLESLGRYDIKALSAVGSAAVSVLVTWWAVGHDSNLAIAFGLCSGAATNLLFTGTAGVWLLGRLPGKASQIGASDIAQMVKMGIQIRIGGLANLGLEPTIRYLLLRFGDVTSAGNYEIAYRVVIQLRAILVSATQVMVPRFSRSLAQGEFDSRKLLPAATALAIRLATLVFWPTQLLLAFVAMFLSGGVHLEILWFGAILSLAWLVNFASAPAYFSNFIEGHLRVNRWSHVLMLAGVVLLGPLAGYFFAGRGVVLAAAVSIAGGSLAVLIRREHEGITKGIALTTLEAALFPAGLLVTLFTYYRMLNTTSSTSSALVVYGIAALYAALMVRPVLRILSSYLHEVAG